MIHTYKGRGVRFVAEVSVANGGEDTVVAQTEKSGRRKRAWLAGAAGAIALGASATALWLRPAEPRVPEHVPFGIAVLPVANLAGSPQDQALADGLTEQNTHRLSQNGYPVVARTSAALWRERAADVRELGATLGVSHVLEGSVRRDR